MDGKKERSEIHQFIDNYAKFLVRYIPTELIVNNPDLRILSIGCGFGFELKGLQQLFSDAYIEAIDRDEEMVHGARQENPQFPADRINVADATRRESLGNQGWDLIVIRNPNVSVYANSINRNWERVFKNSLDAIKPGGFLFLTTQEEPDMEGALNFLSQLPMRDVTPHTVHGSHIISPSLGHQIVFSEKCVAVFKKS